MQRPVVHTLTFAAFAGALAPGALVLLRGLVTSALWGPQLRIAAFLHAGPPPGMRMQLWAVDTAVGLAVGLVLAWAVTRFAGGGSWRIALAFFGGFVAALLALLLLRGDFGYATTALRQPVTLVFAAAAAAVFARAARAALPQASKAQRP